MSKFRTLAQLAIAVGVMALAVHAAFQQHWGFFFGQTVGLLLVRWVWSAIDAIPRWGENVKRAARAVEERRERD